MVLLTAYASGHYACALLYLVSRRVRPARDGYPQDPVTVLIPARNEGEGALRVIRSLLAQDHAGPLEIMLLVKDRADTSLSCLLSAFPPLPEQPNDAAIALSTGGHRLVIQLTGHDPKHQKINQLARALDTPYVALLDCDHEAYPDWVRTSLLLLQREKSRIVQSRREPIEVAGLFGLWDSLHQHIGCEVANVAYDSLGMTVFFTGTTAVMDSELLRCHPLRDCLTEDTDLSYTLALAGEKILYNPYSGSREEVSPDLYSFLARRRRWAHGHTEAFSRHLGRLHRAPISAAARVQFLFHGVHYLIALAVFSVHALLGLYISLHLPTSALAATLLAAMLLSASICRTQPTRSRVAAAGAWVVLAAWLAPAMALLTAGALALLLGDMALVAVPLPNVALWIGLVGLAAPLTVLLVGLAGYRRLTVANTLLIVVSYPVALYLDIAGILIGLVDLLAGQRIWLAIARAKPAVDTTKPSLIARSRSALVAMRSNIMKPSRWLPASLAAVVLSLGVLQAMPARHIAAAARPCVPLEHDGHPWIVPPGKSPDYCSAENHRVGTRTGSFAVSRSDDLAVVDPTYWDRLDSTFFCNNAVFSKDHVRPAEGGGIALTLSAEPRQGKDYTSASIATTGDDLLYGRYEVAMQVPAVSGVLTAFFLYRFDPWQEIDMEFLGKDTTKTLINVFYNPGEPGDLYNYGYRGTPVLVDLGFDAAAAVHTYAIEWDPGEIRWFADGELIHARPNGTPTPIPHLPMRFHINTWPICSEELAGALDVSALPASTLVRSVTVSRWVAPWMWRGMEPSRWREHADWMKP